MESGAKKTVLEDLTKEELINKCKGLLSIAQKAKQAKTELQNEVESYKLQLEQCQTEKNISQESVRTLQELVDSLTEQKLNYITDLDSAQNNLKSIKSKCESYEDELKKYKSDLLIEEKKNVDLAQKLSDLDSESISLRRQNNRLLEENEQLINQLTELESQTNEFNNIGLQQREQLRILEEKVQTDEFYKSKINELNNTITQLKSKSYKEEIDVKINELNKQLVIEKAKNERANVKLRNYKDKILKCASCINQLKNSRFILSNTVKEYSENIPKWRNDIIKASKVLEVEINTLNDENKLLKDKLTHLEKQTNDTCNSLEHSDLISKNNTLQIDLKNIAEQVKNVTASKEILEKNNESLKTRQLELENKIKNIQDEFNACNDQMSGLQCKYIELSENDLPAKTKEIEFLNIKIHELGKKIEDLEFEKSKLHAKMKELKSRNDSLGQTLDNSNQNIDVINELNLHIRALESEKSTLVKEKLNARDHVVELEKLNADLAQQLSNLRSETQTLKTRFNTLSLEKQSLEVNTRNEKESEINNLMCKLRTLQEQYDSLKKEHENSQDLNGLLREEVETLKLSLEQPNYDSDNLSDLNVSLQADIVKLETKLSAYKQENSILLAEVKESRAKVKEFDNMVSEYEDIKSKMTGYKTENTELLNEMKEVNQVLKERGEAISKLQKAVAEMERLIETLERDRDIVKQEKDDLNKKIGTLENDLKQAEQNTSKNHVTKEQLLEERNKAIKELTEEKETIIALLKDEIDKLKQQQISPDLPSEDMSTSTISKAEEHTRMKDLDETFEEKYTKLRIFALKLKKKLNETTAQLQAAEQDKARLEKLIIEQEKDNKLSAPVASESGVDQVDNTVKGSDEDILKTKRITELESEVQSLKDAIEGSEKVAIELGKVKAELHSKTQELSALIEVHKSTKESLEKARRDIKKKNVLSLEMEDYERSMKELTTKMEESKKKIIQMESTIDTQEGTITAMKTQIKLLEEQIKSEETQNRMVKEELQRALEEGKEKDNVVQIKNNIISQLEQQLEDEKRKNEETNLETTSILTDKEKIIISLGEEKVELNNKLKRLEFKYAELNETLRITNIELADLKTEYTSYKVRAQAVLRQNQTVDHSQEEQLKEEAAALRTHIETLSAKVATLQEQLDEQTVEMEASRRRAAEASSEAARAQQRTSRLQADLTRIGQQLESERTQHKLQISTLTQCYRTQISDLETKLQRETDALKKQLAASQDVPKTVKVSTFLEPNHNQYMLPVIPKDDSDGEMDINVSLIPREEGEGSEAAPSPPLSKSYFSSAGGSRSPVPLERLLEEGVPEDESLDTTSLGLTPEQEISDLRRKLQAQQQRVKHVTVLLSESERECARMAQLSELLKSEIRRVRGTNSNAHNTEYMKNVTLKFLTLPPGDERSRLVPVLQKILTLAPDEMQKIQAIAKGQDPNQKGWGSYLPWPGGK